MQTKKIVSSIFVAAAFVVALVMMMGGIYDIYIDLPTALIVLFFPLLYQCALFGTRGFVSSFRAPFGDDVSAETLHYARNFFASYGRATWLFAIVACALSAVRMLTDLVNYSMMGVYLAIILLGILYAALFNLMLVGPYLACLDQRLAGDAEKAEAAGSSIPNIG